jgi:hypothetical protein
MAVIARHRRDRATSPGPEKKISVQISHSVWLKTTMLGRVARSSAGAIAQNQGNVVSRNWPVMCSQKDMEEPCLPISGVSVAR